VESVIAGAAETPDSMHSEFASTRETIAVISVCIPDRQVRLRLLWIFAT